MTKKVGEAWVTSWQKRAVDASVAGVLLPSVAPVVALAAGIVASTEVVSPFITQERVGVGGSPVRIAKIRTMPAGTTETMSGGHYDSRRTPFGRILSATRIDEIPQLFNVAGGSMSLVGPRPLVKVHHDEFIASIREPETKRKVVQAYAIARPGWFDPYGVEMYVNGVEDTHEARAESIIKYVYEEASYQRDLQIIYRAFGLLKNLRSSSEVELLPDRNPPPLGQDEHVEPDVA